MANNGHLPQGGTYFQLPLPHTRASAEVRCEMKDENSLRIQLSQPLGSALGSGARGRCTVMPYSYRKSIPDDGYMYICP